ncbi:formimidoylglutamate deiminase [Sphingomonas sp. SUN019]|uniref:formimidoylglutamate deiminase n=1 Tax=Sphingomonas sp. SUN019 TaxID=2937788 RepID=UPI0021644E63|nr:formimidoylglutamate deiminase [Sphingomonas sp. SUN019]UVO52422.1 formimidoylglutamate deiminase [Sphingomonas sp. SUN019]
MSVTTLWFASALLPDGWAERVRITIADGRIAGVERDVSAAAEDESHAVALPGLPNLHSHAFQRLMAGLAEAPGAPGQDDFWGWRTLMYRLVERLTPDDVAAIAALAYVEMAEAGFTRVGEFHYLHHAPDGRGYDDLAAMAAAIATAADETGIALTLLPVFYAHSDFGGALATAQQRRFVNDLDGFARLLDASRAAVRSLPDTIVGVAPHSLRAVAPDELDRLVTLANGAPIHIHVAEQVREVERCLAWSGQRPVDWLLDHAPVDERWCLIHATHVEESELARIIASGAVVGLCPVTEANLGDGIFPAADYLARGGAFGIGTDSNVRIDAAEELRLLEYGQRLTLRRRAVLAQDGRSTGRALFDAALAGGAQALGAIGGLAVGAPADIVALAEDSATGDTILDRWIFARTRGVDAVWRGGRRIVSEGRHVHRDAIERRYAQVAARLLTA